MVPAQLRLGGAGSYAAMLGLAFCGLAVWRVSPLAFGVSEAYDSDDTWTLCIVLAGIPGWLVPHHAWRWGLALASLQVVDATLDIAAVGGPYAWRALAFFAVYALLLALVAEAAATLRRLGGLAFRDGSDGRQR